MTSRVALAATAAADIRAATRWLCDERSPAAADKWLAGLLKAMKTLKSTRYVVRWRQKTTNSPKTSASCFTAGESTASTASSSRSSKIRSTCSMFATPHETKSILEPR